MTDNSEEIFAKVMCNSKMTALGQISAGLVHEINNPLTVIQGRCYQLQQAIENNKTDPKTLTSICESILLAAEKIGNITKGMRSFGRGPDSDTFEPVPIHQLIADTVDFCRTRFHNHSVELVIDVIPQELTTMAQAIPLQQALLALLNNAFENVQSSEKKSIHIATAANQEIIEIIVKDSGAKIEDSETAKIFQAFYTTKENHAGLGLSVAKQILSSFGAELLLRQTPEKQFVIQLKRS